MVTLQSVPPRGSYPIEDGLGHRNGSFQVLITLGTGHSIRGRRLCLNERGLRATADEQGVR